MPNVSRLSDLQLLKSTVNQMTMDLETGSAPGAPPVVVAALEVAVCTDTLPLFLRGFAFYKLLKIWAAARHSDLESLSPSSLSISQGGLGGSFLPFSVAKDTFFLRPDWETMGMSLWKAEDVTFSCLFFATGSFWLPP